MISKQSSINFIIGLIFNQSYNSDLAWEAPHILRKRLKIGELDLKKIELLGLDGFTKLVSDKPALHRFPNVISGYTYNSILIINQQFEGDPRNMWSGHDYQKIIDNLRLLHGIGDHKAKQGVVILSKMDSDIHVPESLYYYLNETCPALIPNLRNNILQITKDEKIENCL